MKTAVRALRGPFARKHSRWILIAALKWKHPGRVGEVARKVLEQREAKTLPRILRLRQRNARNSGAGKGLVGIIELELPASNGIREAVSRVASGLDVPCFGDRPGSAFDPLSPVGLILLRAIHKLPPI